jgi:hypothetical protein
VLAHFLYEAYKFDVGGDIIAVTCYPNTFRRRLIDFAVKVVKTGGQFILKVAEQAFEELQIARLWLRTSEPLPIGIT